MRMTITFASFALVAVLVSQIFPHLAGGLGRTMMAIYLGMAVVSAALALLARRGSG